MSTNLDASVIVALTDVDGFEARAACFIRACGPVVVSDFAMVEVASALARLVRTGTVSVERARAGVADLRAWTERAASREPLQSADVAFADTALNRFDLTLKTADALHIAITHRIGATLATFDRKQAASARILGCSAVEP